MWLSKMLTKSTGDSRAETGRVTMTSSSKIEVQASVSSRSINSYTPYGYSVRVPIGEEIILVPSSDGEVALGVKSGGNDLEAGEIKISSKGGASLELKNDGSVIINNSVVIDKEGHIDNG